MKTVGIICEYNPFHQGHQKQIIRIRQEFGDDVAIVCLMSGNYVQRGMPAVFDKSLRTEAAIRCGADLVLELPTVVSLSSAEGFAAGGVKILSPFCDSLCFGCETAREDTLMETARALLLPDFSLRLREELKNGCSFPSARQKALAAMGRNTDLLEKPNDILAVEYCKAMMEQGSSMKPFPIRREGNYHETVADIDNPSATALRQLICEKGNWSDYMPTAAATIFQNASVHSLQAGERAILARLRTMDDEEFAALPYGSEGLWRKFMHACRSCAALEEIITATKSKRYTRTRLDRMVMCAYLGITGEMLQKEAPYVRVLGFTANGVSVLKKARETGSFPHIGEKTADAYEMWEQRWDDLYGLFSHAVPTPCGQTHTRRMYIEKQ